MANKTAKTKTTGKRTKVKDVPTTKKMTADEMKKVKGGLKLSPWIVRNKKGDGS